MEHAPLVTIPTIVHLMKATDSKIPGDKHNTEVLDTKELFPEIFASADHEKSVNAIWKKVARFKLDPDIGIVEYHLKDFGVELGEGEQIRFKCSSPPTEEDQLWFRNVQEKFGRHGFQGLQIFVLARISNATGDAGLGGCTMSRPAGVTGSAWLDAPAVIDHSFGFFRPMAHEIGHFLSLPHVQVPTGLMNPDPDAQGRNLSDDELERAHKRAVEVMQ